jgi:hypothetical protein
MQAHGCACLQDAGIKTADAVVIGDPFTGKVAPTEADALVLGSILQVCGCVGVSWGQGPQGARGPAAGRLEPEVQLQSITV